MTDAENKRLELLSDNFEVVNKALDLAIDHIVKSHPLFFSMFGKNLNLELRQRFIIEAGTLVQIERMTRGEE